MEDRAVAHRVGFSVLSHFEGFAGPEAMEDENRLVHRDLVQNWDLGAQVRANVDMGVYLVEQDCPGVEDNFLKVSKGAFVRVVHDPPTEVPGHCEYVRTCEPKQGLVPKAALTQIARHASEPAPPRGFYQNPTNRPDAGPGRAFASPQKSTRNTPKTPVIPAGVFSATTPTGTSKRTKAKAAELNVRLAFFRAVAATNKAGKQASMEDNRANHIASFEFLPGEFLLDNGPRPQNSRFVTRIEGSEGAANMRLLQPLESPWGFPRSVLIMPKFDQHLEYSALKNAVRAVGIRSSDQRQGTLMEALRGWHFENGIDLPLSRLRLQEPIISNVGVRFLNGEIVRVMRKLTGKDIPKQRTIEVRDYENNATVVAIDDLEHLRNPFGIVLNKTGLDYDMKARISSDKQIKLPKSSGVRDSDNRKCLRFSDDEESSPLAKKSKMAQKSNESSTFSTSAEKSTTSRGKAQKEQNATPFKKPGKRLDINDLFGSHEDDIENEDEDEEDLKHAEPVADDAAGPKKKVGKKLSFS